MKTSLMLSILTLSVSLSAFAQTREAPAREDRIRGQISGCQTRGAFKVCSKIHRKSNLVSYREWANLTIYKDGVETSALTFEGESDGMRFTGDSEFTLLYGSQIKNIDLNTGALTEAVMERVALGTGIQSRPYFLINSPDGLIAYYIHTNFKTVIWKTDGSAETILPEQTGTASGPDLVLNIDEEMKFNYSSYRYMGAAKKRYQDYKYFEIKKGENNTLINPVLGASYMLRAFTTQATPIRGIRAQEQFLAYRTIKFSYARQVTPEIEILFSILSKIDARYKTIDDVMSKIVELDKKNEFCLPGLSTYSELLFALIKN